MAPEEVHQLLSTTEYFKKLADSYGDGGYYRKRREATLAAVKQEVGSIANLLDLGCGNGTYLVRFRENINPPLLVGADLTLEMLQGARMRAGGTPIGLLRCDASRMPFSSAVWECIFTSHVLQFVANLGGCVVDIARCLTPGGVLIIAGGELGVRERFSKMITDQRWSMLAHTLPRPRNMTAERRALNDYRDAATNAGLTVELHRAPFTVTLGDIAEFYQVRWLPLLDDSAQSKLSEVLTDLAAERGAEEFELTEPLLFCRRVL